MTIIWYTAIPLGIFALAMILWAELSDMAHKRYMRKHGLPYDERNVLEIALEHNKAEREQNRRIRKTMRRMKHMNW